MQMWLKIARVGSVLFFSIALDAQLIVPKTNLIFKTQYYRSLMESYLNFEDIFKRG